MYTYGLRGITYNLRPVWLVVLIGGNGNDLYCKISSKIPYYSHGDETLITISLQTSLPLNTTSPNGNALEIIL